MYTRRPQLYTVVSDSKHPANVTLTYVSDTLKAAVTSIHKLLLVPIKRWSMSARFAGCSDQKEVVKLVEDGDVLETDQTVLRLPLVAAPL